MQDCVVTIDTDDRVFVALRTGHVENMKSILLVDCVLMYAQRGSGKRSSFFSDYTFGCWDGDPDTGADLLPVGKAYSGFTDEELKKLDRHVRQNTVNRFGPVRETDKSLVFEVAFDSVHDGHRVHD